MATDEFLLFRVHRFLGCPQFALQELNLLLELSLILLPLFLRRSAEMLQSLSGMLVLFFQGLPVAFFGVNSSSVQMTRLGHKGYPLVLFCRNLTEARAAMCAELFSMFR